MAQKLTHPDELAMLGRLGRFPGVVAESAALREPHRIIFFLQEISQAFQSYYTRLYAEGDPILPRAAQAAEEGFKERWDWAKTSARIAWIEAIRVVYGAGLRLAGITALARMERLDETREADDEETATP